MEPSPQACRGKWPPSSSEPLDSLAANSGGLLQRSRVIERSLLRWQQTLAKEVDPLGIRVKSVGPRLMATQVNFNGGQRWF